MAFVTGLDVLPASPGCALPPLSDTQPSNPSTSGMVAIIDAQVKFARPGGTVFAAGRTVYARNLFVQGASVLANVSGSLVNASLPPAPAWVHVPEFVFGANTEPIVRGRYKWQYEASIYRHGARFPPGSHFGSPVAPFPAPATDFQAMHGFGMESSSFPSPDTPMAADISIFGAVGDGQHDNADAIQRALDAHDVVVVPRGVFAVSRTIVVCTPLVLEEQEE